MSKLIKNKKSNLLTKIKRQPAKLTELKSFLKIADANLIEAMKRSCRNTFPLVIEQFDGLSAQEIANGLHRLPQAKSDAIFAAMRADKFTCFAEPIGRKPKTKNLVCDKKL